MKIWVCGCTRVVGAAAAAAVAATAVAGVPDPRINEIRVGQTGPDVNEYVELAGTPGPLTGYYLIVLGDDGGSDGTVEEVINYLGQAIKVSGFHTTVDIDYVPPPPNANFARPLNFNGGNRTVLLVTDFTGMIGDDLDTDDDGVLDIIPWSPPEPVDCIALVGPGTPGIDGAQVYCPTHVGPDGDFAPGHAYRCDPDLTWTIGDFDFNGPGATDTPGEVNTSCDFIPPCGSGLAGNCFVANGTPYCDDEACCNDIIDNYDPSCATVWDQGCADLAELICRSCGDPEAGDCFTPNGTAYCNNAACCDLVCTLDLSCCDVGGWDQICADLATANCVLPGVEPDDVVVGLSDPDPDVTLALARGDRVLLGGAVADEFWSQVYMQSMEFDNLNGISHNPAGNLLGVNFGTTATGGTIYSLPTCEAVGPGVLIGDTAGLGGAGVTLSRLGGLSVSPDNTKIAVTAYDTGKVIVYDYTAGDCLVGGALSGARETAQSPLCIADTQGTAWLDDDTVLAFSSVGGIWEVDATTMVATEVTTLAGTSCGPAFTDIEFNPILSPYVFAAYSDFVTATLNTLYILDPANSYGIVNQVDYSTSINTTREIAFDHEGNLMVSQYTGNVDLIEGAAANAATLADNVSLDWFNTQADVGFSSFPGLDVAANLTATQPCPWDCQPVPNGQVDVSDFLAILAQFGQVGTSCDFDGGGVSVTDFLAFLAHFGPCP